MLTRLEKLKHLLGIENEEKDVQLLCVLESVEELIWM